ncbi:unnamed protein product [Vitrella brassicaformis CCMP3155]|uniref:Xaa-Pro aminopeptidase n=2 Tax=Vitrella brassicaformis TaxID=1169539 RepID=A0A0G4GNH8_VITBC|nr:unnamed protein product [Vitrella brassicaformis CCMP3155]|eukprot:CEM31841.1 unnamed protein product [Vitrella brassicaformis CCMP3155]
MTPAAKLSALREEMRKAGVTAFVVLTQDAHNSEYVGKRDMRRAWISGFTGSQGVAVVTVGEGDGGQGDQALLWTDGRYFLQAEKELSPEWTLMRQGLQETPTIPQWLKRNVAGQIGLDPYCVSISFYTSLTDALGATRITLIDPPNLIDRIWPDQPPMASSQCFVQPLQYAGKSVKDKVADVRKKMSEEGELVHGLVVARLDEVAWLLNLRGSDIPYTPVFLGYVVVPVSGSVRVYVNEAKLTDEVKAHLAENDITDILPYDNVVEDVKRISQMFSYLRCYPRPRMWIDPSTNVALHSAIPPEVRLMSHTPIMVMKAVKTGAEIEGTKHAHIRDGAAKSRYLHWLEKTIVTEGKEGLDEVDLADKLQAFRSEMADYVDLSFPSISAVGSNGAIIHYKPEKSAGCKKITRNEMYLIDSGAQYRDGTTDVTRTLHLGTPSQKQKECFTRVLKGHVAVARCIFPATTTGTQLDCLARQHLWEVGLDYLHGTGHGVGSFLCVHEGPIGITTKGNSRAGAVPLQPGMIVSNEPGYYESNEWGIRIENLVTVVKAETRNNFPDSRDYYGFENLTMVPIQKKLIDLDLLTRDEVLYLNDYHDEVRAKLEPYAQRDPDFLAWLHEATLPLPVPPLQTAAPDRPPPTSMYQ